MGQGRLGRAKLTRITRTRMASLVAIAALAMAREAAAETAWTSLALLGGAVRPDNALAGYQWDTAPRTAWGLQALAGRDRFGLGARMWRGATTQTIDLGSESIAPTVHHTSWELLGRARLAEGWGGRLLASASAGRIGLHYQPERIAFDPGSGDPIEVELRPVNAWSAGGGLAFERPLARTITLALSFDTRFYSIETAHRDGEAIVVGRQTFEDWSARAELAWLHRWKGPSR